MTFFKITCTASVKYTHNDIIIVVGRLLELTPDRHSSTGKQKWSNVDVALTIQVHLHPHSRNSPNSTERNYLSLGTRPIFMFMSVFPLDTRRHVGQTSTIDSQLATSLPGIDSWLAFCLRSSITVVSALLLQVTFAHCVINLSTVTYRRRTQKKTFFTSIHEYTTNKSLVYSPFYTELNSRGKSSFHVSNIYTTTSYT